jgi:hypothetical protein
LLSSLRRKAAVARSFSKDDLNHLAGKSETYWYKSPVDPMKLLRVFKRLSLKPKYTLRAYVHFDGGNGNGIVWGMPENSIFPEPKNCERFLDHFLKPPRPPKSIPVEDVLVGNSKPWSYLEASIFLRELLEFGAQWHGCSWSDIEILYENPFHEKPKNPTRLSDGTFNLRQWKWVEKKITDWRSEIIIEPEKVRVFFYIYNPVGMEAIKLNEDVYIKGCYKPEVKKHLIAEGPGGIVY